MLKRFCGILLIVFSMASVAHAAPFGRSDSRGWGEASGGYDSPWGGDVVSAAYAPEARLLDLAYRYVGRANPTGYREAWCADFANFIMDQAGVRHVASHRAIDGLGNGPRVSQPQPGDLAILGGRRHNHETFFAGFDPGGNSFKAVGGNQGHHLVTVAHYPTSSVLAFVQPAGYGEWSATAPGRFYHHGGVHHWHHFHHWRVHHHRHHRHGYRW